MKRVRFVDQVAAIESACRLGGYNEAYDMARSLALPRQRATSRFGARSRRWVTLWYIARQFDRVFSSGGCIIVDHMHVEHVTRLAGGYRTVHAGGARAR